MIIGITGHRPDKIGGYDPLSFQRKAIRKELERRILKYKPTGLISGMALGIDTDAAHIALKHKIPLIAAVPFKGQEIAWNESSQDEYREILKHASKIHVVSSGGYAPWKMQVRNQYMVDNCDVMIGVYDGTSGGTGNCITYAKKKKRILDIIDPKDGRFQPIDMEKTIAIMIYGLVREKTTEDFNSCKTEFEALDTEMQDALRGAAQGFIETINQQGIFLIDREDAEAVIKLSSQVQTQLTN